MAGDLCGFTYSGPLDVEQNHREINASVNSHTT